jgi:hypothetical protein
MARQRGGAVGVVRAEMQNLMRLFGKDVRMGSLLSKVL